MARAANQALGRKNSPQEHRCWFCRAALPSITLTSAPWAARLCLVELFPLFYQQSPFKGKGKSSAFDTAAFQSTHFSVSDKPRKQRKNPSWYNTLFPFCLQQRARSSALSRSLPFRLKGFQWRSRHAAATGCILSVPTTPPRPEGLHSPELRGNRGTHRAEEQQGEHSAASHSRSRTKAGLCHTNLLRGNKNKTERKREKGEKKKNKTIILFPKERNKTKS